MSNPLKSWEVNPTQYQQHPGQWAYEEFEAWANHSEKKGHLAPGQAKHIVRMFDNACHESDPHAALHSKLFSSVQQGHIDAGKMHFIQSVATQILHQKNLMRGSQQPAPSAAAQPASAIDQQRIQQIAQQSKFVWFYKAPENTLTACFGNFFEVPGKVLGCRTAEGAFQAQKFVGDPYHAFANLDGDSAWKLARNFPGTQKANWHQGEKINAMKRVIADKFKFGSPLASALLATGSAYLVEHNPVKGRDSFWSDDSDGTGQNMLGQLLMERRMALGGTGTVTAPSQYTQNVTNLR